MFADIGSCVQKAGLSRSRPRGGMEGDTGGAAAAGEGPERVGRLPSRHRGGKASGDAGQQGTDFLVFTETRSGRRQMARHAAGVPDT